MLEFRLNGQKVSALDREESLLALLREQKGIRSTKDGCSPQGQCGACTVLVDGAPRVSCVTPARRAAGREVTTLEGLGPACGEWAEAFCATGASQCGFCTPGIIVRLEGLRRRRGLGDARRSLAAHLCRCTGWQTILEAWEMITGGDTAGSAVPDAPPERPAPLRPRAAQATAASRPLTSRPLMRNFAAAAARAQLEGRCPQEVGAHVALGAGGFAADGAPPDALVAVPSADDGWSLGETLAEARAAAGFIAGRRSGLLPSPPLEFPPGDWAVKLRTCWVEPAYLELDASWCLPGGEPANPLANGGAFGGKLGGVAQAAARRLADSTGRGVRVLYSREDVTRLGPKRPPVAGALSDDERGVLRAVRTPGLAEAVASVAPFLAVEEVDVPGPSTTMNARAAVLAEIYALLAAARARLEPVSLPGCGVAAATLSGQRQEEEVIEVEVRCGRPLDEVVLRSYCIGAAHMAYSLVTSEAVAVDVDGSVADLTLRSFGVIPAARTPRVEVSIVPSDEDPLNGSDAVFVAVAAATWLARGAPEAWPTDRFGSPPLPAES